MNFLTSLPFLIGAVVFAVIVCAAALWSHMPDVPTDLDPHP